jgi:hypothetical protein
MVFLFHPIGVWAIFCDDKIIGCRDLYQVPVMFPGFPDVDGGDHGLMQVVCDCPILGFEIYFLNINTFLLLINKYLLSLRHNFNFINYGKNKQHRIYNSEYCGLGNLRWLVHRSRRLDSQFYSQPLQT